MYYNLHFEGLEDLGYWARQIASVHWVVETIDSMESGLIEEWDNKAIETMKLEISFYKKNSNAVVFESLCDSARKEKLYIKFNKDIDAKIWKGLKMQKLSKDNVTPLSSYLWIKMIETLKVEIKNYHDRLTNSEPKIVEPLYDERNWQVSFNYTSGTDEDKCRAMEEHVHGGFFINSIYFDVSMVIELNKKQSCDTLHNSFEALAGKMYWNINSNAFPPYTICKGDNICFLKKKLVQLWQDYEGNDWNKMDAPKVVEEFLYQVSLLEVNKFHEWREEEIERLWPTHIEYYKDSLHIDFVECSEPECYAEISFKGFSGEEKEFKLKIDLHPQGITFCGLNVWDVFDHISISSICDKKFPNLPYQGSLANFFPRMRDIFNIVNNYEDFWDDFRFNILEKLKNEYNGWAVKNDEREYEEARKKRNERRAEEVKAAMKEWMRKTLEESHIQYTFMMPFVSPTTTLYGDATVRIDFDNKYMEDAARQWFRSRVKYYPTLDITKDDLGSHLLKWIHGNWSLKCALPKNPKVIDYTRTGMEDGEFVKDVKKQMDVNSATGLLEFVKSELVKLYWKEDFKLPPNTKEVLNELNATNEQKAKVAEDFEIVCKLNPFYKGTIDAITEEKMVENAMKELNLLNFDLHRCINFPPEHFRPSCYRIEFSTEDYNFIVRLCMKDFRSLNSWQLTIDRRGEQLHNTSYGECDENEGKFVQVMDDYLEDIFKAKAIKRKILLEIYKVYGRDIEWRG